MSISQRCIEQVLDAMEKLRDTARDRGLTMTGTEVVVLTLAAAVHELDDTLQQALPNAGKG